MVFGLQFSTTVVLVGEPVVTGYDAGSRPVYSKAETSSPGWVLWPAGSTEDVTQEDIVTDILNALAPPGTDVSAVSQVKVLGDAYQVEGKPYPYLSPFTGTAPGVHLMLKRVS